MFKILSLDGGGIRGTYTASVLAQLESQLERPVIDHFDLVVGTSTGGIIALGLATGMCAEEILSFYKNAGAQIFPPARLGWRALIDWIFTPKFEAKDLEVSLRQVFGNKTFSEIERNVAVTSFDAATGRPVVFKTAYHESLSGFGELSVVDVAMATSAAPTYFPAARTVMGVMIDGGVWANCPVMVGVTDAISLFGCSPRDIRVLSVGTTTTPEFIKEPVRDGGIFEWAKPIPSVLMHATKLASIEQAKKLCGRFVRVDDTVDAGRFELDDVRAIGDLEQMGRAIARRMFQELKCTFFARRTRRKITPNKTMHTEPSIARV